LRIRDINTEEDLQINMTPMIDMVFLLLIFFLAAASFAKQERHVDIHLPSSSGSKALSEPSKQLVINILQDGGIDVASKQYDHAGFAAFLAERLRDAPEREILIRADGGSHHRDFAEVVRMCRDLGVTNLKIGYVVPADSSRP